MSCTNDLLTELGGWLNTVAHNFATGYLHWEDLYQEGALAVLESGTVVEPLAKTIAVRAMNKYRKRHGSVRVTNGAAGADHTPLKRQGYEDLTQLGYESSIDGVFWENLEGETDGEKRDVETLRQWTDSSDSFGDFCKTTGLSIRAVRDRINRASDRIREKWQSKGVEYDCY